MPNDLTPQGETEWVQVRDPDGTGLPFSKGLLATSILATGLTTDRAYAIAAEVQRELHERHLNEIDAETLADMAVGKIDQHIGAEHAARYRAWRKVKRSGRPLVIAFGGAPGVGKSTLATRLAVRLGITRVVTTDTIREVLRTVIPATVLPELHLSTFESPKGMSERAQLGSFDRQAHAVGAATGAVAIRLATEKRSVIVEGVHMLPGQITEALCDHATRPIVVEMLLVLGDERLHRAHLSHRLNGEPARGGKRHLTNLPRIRAIQADLVEMAEAHGVAIYDIANPNRLTQRIVDQIVAQVDQPSQATGAHA